MRQIKRILVPVDFSNCSRAALDYAAYLANTFDASIDVLHVHEPSYLVGDVMVTGNPPKLLSEYIQERAQESLDHMLARLDTPAKVTPRFVEGPVDREILRAVEDEEFDLVVMGTHGRTGLSHFLIGSIAEKVLRKSACPVLTVRRHDPPESSGVGG